MKMRFTAAGDIGVVHVDERRIDAGGAIGFKESFRQQINGTAGPVILDLGRVEFLDSSGLGAVVAIRKLLGTDRPLALCALQPAVEKVMTLTRMNTVFAIHATVEAAIAAQATPAAP